MGFAVSGGQLRSTPRTLVTAHLDEENGMKWLNGASSARPSAAYDLGGYLLAIRTLPSVNAGFTAPFGLLRYRDILRR
jgi:hypothetical protein